MTPNLNLKVVRNKMNDEDYIFYLEERLKRTCIENKNLFEKNNNLSNTLEELDRDSYAEVIG